MTEYLTPFTPQELKESSTERLPDNFFDDVMPLLEGCMPALAISRKAWEIADQAKEEIYAQAGGRKLHPKDIALLEATEQNCTKICLENIDPLIESGGIAQRAERVGKTARSLVGLIVEKEPSKQKGTSRPGIDSSVLTKLQAARIAGLGAQQIVHDELHTMVQIDEFASPLAIVLAKLVRRRDPPLNELEAELARVASTIHKQDPRQNFILDLYSNGALTEADLQERFLHTGLVGDADSAQSVPTPPALKPVFDVMKLHVDLLGNIARASEDVPQTQSEAEILARYVQWMCTSSWTPALKAGLTEYTAATKQRQLDRLDADFTNHYIAGRDFYRIAPIKTNKG